MSARSGSSHFAKFFNRFFDKLYAYMLENGITQIYQLGDLFDQRQQLNLKTFYQCKPHWFDPLEEYGFTMHTLIGNHDITLRESLEINTQESVLQQYIRTGAVKVYKEPTFHKVDDHVSFDIIPWICTENKESVREFISRKNPADFCLGHFEINGACMYKGIQSTGHDGLPTNMFEKYEGVLSGHYHTRSFLEIGDTGKLINYIGTPYELTWMDAHDQRGFTVLDTEKRTLEFIPTTETMFRKVYYRGENPIVEEHEVTGKFVKLIVEKKGDLYQYDSFINTLRSWSPYDLAIVENIDGLTNGEIGDDENLDIEDTVTIIAKYIDSLQTDIDKNKVKDYINGLYIEALNA